MSNVAAWQTVLCGGDPVQFARRLTWSQLDEAAVERLADAVARPTGQAAALLDEVLRASRSAAQRLGRGRPTLPQDRAFSAKSPVPFEHVWVAVLRLARRRVQRHVGTRTYVRLASSAHAGLERVLLHRISGLATRALYRAFAPARSAHGLGAYAAFVHAQLGAGLGDLFGAYPVLARLLATLVTDWVDATAELLVRFAEDAPHIAAALDCAQLGRVVRVDAGLSDPHAGARQVAILYPSDGPPVVYKPRSLAFDAAYAELVRWLATALPLGAPRPRAVRVLDRGTHGWVEHVAAAPCPDAAASARYFDRAGAVLCIAHVLRGGDLHSENVIAAGEHPLLIDLEVLCEPVPAEGVHSASGFERIVLDTGLLPRVEIGGNGAGRVDGGIEVSASRAAPPRPAGERTEPCWRHINTDSMDWGVGRQGAEPAADAPVGGVPLSPPLQDREAAAAISKGFRRTYLVLHARKAELLAEGGPLAGAAAGASRVLLRSTSVYSVLLRRTTHPAFLSEPLARLAELDVLRRPYLRGASRPAIWPALDAECDAMQRLDVPLFTVPADGTDLHAYGRGVVVPGYAAMSGYEAVRRGVEGMGRARLDRQMHHIRVALAADEHRCTRGRGERFASESATDVTVIGSEEAFEEVSRLAALLRAVARVSHGGLALWHAQDIGGGQRRIAPAGLDLSRGQAGIGLFFAAHSHVLRRCERGSDAQDAALWARMALRPVCAAIRSERRGVPARPGLGVGWGGIAYALANAARLLDEADLLDASRAALRRVGRPPFRAASDVFSGLAGAVLGALAVHAVTGCGDDLALAASWGDELLTRQWWRRRENGFGHGRAGVAASLLRLAARTGDGRYASATVHAALKPPGHTRPDAISGWCRGLPGLGLARAAALATNVGTSAERATWSSTLARVAEECVADDRAPWTLCCGALARIDLLLAAASALHRPALAHAARVLAGRVVAGARRRRSYAFPPQAEALVPGLYRGVAGTAFMLLRVADPEALSSPLLADAQR